MSTNETIESSGGICYGVDANQPEEEISTDETIKCSGDVCCAVDDSAAHDQEVPLTTEKGGSKKNEKEMMHQATNIIPVRSRKDVETLVETGSRNDGSQNRIDGQKLNTAALYFESSLPVMTTTMSGNNSKNRAIRKLHRFEPTLMPIEVVAAEPTQDDYYKVSLLEFEKLIEERLDESENDTVPALYYMDRDDFSWLKCRRPLYALETILGLEEEHDEQDSIQAHIIKIRTFVPSPSSPSLNAQYVDNVPQYSWERTTLESNDIDYAPPSSTELEWYDLRSLATDFELPTSASCVHFLRCLLDARHDASPWVPPGAEKTDADEMKDVVILLLDRHSVPKKLVDFRVSDACPSWFLHAVGKFENINSQNIPWVQKTGLNGVGNDDAVMLIYRRLPLRDSLNPKHPQSKQSVNLKGCLWESSLSINKSGEIETNYTIVAPPIVNVQKEFPGLVEPLLTESAMDILQNEAMLISHWTAWPERTHYSGGDGEEAPWTVFPICHTFPAHILENKVWVPSTCSFVPRTVELLKRHLGEKLRTALFSRLEPDSFLNAHTGWSDLANSVVRLHIPLILPATGKLCGVWVDGCVQIQEPGKPVCFDDSKTHRAFNYSSECRIVLILDLVRPDGLPRGTATGGHTDELDQFIEQMGMAR